MDSGEGEAGGADLACGGVEAESAVQVGCSGLLECIVRLGLELEADPLADGEPV